MSGKHEDRLGVGMAGLLAIAVVWYIGTIIIQNTRATLVTVVGLLSVVVAAYVLGFLINDLPEMINDWRGDDQ